MAMSQHWFSYFLTSNWQQTFAQTNVAQNACPHLVSLGNDDLMMFISTAAEFSMVAYIYAAPFSK